MPSVIQVGRLMTNCYILDDGQGGVVVIDPGAEPERIMRAVGDRRLSLILVTHFHEDHTGALNDIVANSEGGWIIGEVDYPFLTADRPDDPRLAGIPVIEQPPARLVREGDVIEVGDLSFEVIDCPGHTPGGVTYLERRRNLAYTGDTLFAGSRGRTDLYGGDEVAIGETLVKLSKLPAHTQILPGHGQTGVMEYELISNKLMRRALGLE